ncbi:MAG: L,D-transpeptidase family protein [Salinimicrobium sp.]
MLNLSLLLLGMTALVSCNGEAETRSKTAFTKDASAVIEKDTVKTEKEEKEPRKLVTYHLDSLGTKAAVDSFKTRYDKEQQSIIYALNRMDPRRLNAGDKIVIPDSVTAELLAYAPFPEELDLLDSIPKAVLISRRIQAVALYQNGELIKWGPASTGKESTQTPAGLFYGNYKAKRKISTIDKDWIMPYYFNFMNYEGIGTHEYTLPGYPASHGCVRLRNEEAVYIYNWATQWQLNSGGQVVLQNGTPFMVLGDYDFDHPSPWLDQADDPKANFFTSEEKQTISDYVKRYQNNAKNFEQNKTPEGELNLPPKTRLQTIN